MLNDDFLTIYNEELAYLRDVGRYFALENPQVAQYLGMHADSIIDPFVERLLEGTAFLTARVQQRLNHEQPEFALQMLSRLAPLWHTPIPSMAMIALTPDLTYPQWHEKVHLPRGSKVLLSDPALNNKTATFTTARDLTIQPISLEHVECAAMPPNALPQSVLMLLQGSQAVMNFRFSTKRVCGLSDLDWDPVRLTLTCDAVRANQILSLLLNQTLRVILWAKSDKEPIIHELSPADIRLDGVDDNEALLPTTIGEFPGARLLREYFHAPFRFYGVQLLHCAEFFKKCQQRSEFELIFALKQRPLALLGRLSCADFRLFAMPIVNLYRRRCQPIFLTHQKTEHHVIVDRLQPTLYQIHHLLDVKGSLTTGEAVDFSSLFGEVNFDSAQNGAGYSLRRKPRQIEEKRYRKSVLPHDDMFITLSPGSAEIDLDHIQSLSIEAMVCERHLVPDNLQQPEWQLDVALPIHSVEMIRYPTNPVGAPEIAVAWRVLQALSNNPLRFARPRFNDCSAVIRDWLMLFADMKNPAHRKWITGIQSAHVDHAFERYQGAGPIAWTRGAAVTLDLDPAHYADQSECLFGHILHHALAQFCELNQTLRMSLTVDGHPYAQGGPIG